MKKYRVIVTPRMYQTIIGAKDTEELQKKIAEKVKVCPFIPEDIMASEIKIVDIKQEEPKK